MNTHFVQKKKHMKRCLMSHNKEMQIKITLLSNVQKSKTLVTFVW